MEDEDLLQDTEVRAHIRGIILECETDYYEIVRSLNNYVNDYIVATNCGNYFDYIFPTFRKLLSSIRVVGNTMNLDEHVIGVEEVIRRFGNFHPKKSRSSLIIKQNDPASILYSSPTYGAYNRIIRTLIDLKVFFHLPIDKPGDDLSWIEP
jgi:hypothetical protein